MTDQQTEVKPDIKTETYFQALGLIKAIVIKEQNSEKKGKFFKIKFGKFEYPLIGNKNILNYLEMDLKHNPDAERWLMVYPKVLHVPGNEPYKVCFEIKSFNVKKPDIQLDHLEFKLSGLWQFIPVCRTPCITVFKNFTEERLEVYKQSEAFQKVKLTKPAHIPLFWKDALVTPFRFNPKTPKEEQGKPYFVEVKARFLPDRNSFGFDSLRAIPSEEAPKFMKARKEDKQVALKDKQTVLTSKNKHQKISNKIEVKPRVGIIEKPKIKIKTV